MATSLLRHETIRTTVPKAKELRRVVEPLITLAKIDSEAKRRLAYSRLRDVSVVEKLFGDIGPRFKARRRPRRATLPKPPPRKRPPSAARPPRPEDRRGLGAAAGPEDRARAGGGA